MAEGGDISGRVADVNAIRHTRRGGEITIQVTDDGGRLRLEVTDTGEGIAAQDIPHIFERFYRPDKRLDTASENSERRLRLAIVKRIIDLHKSQIDVRSAKGSGAEFSFWLPQPA